MLQMAVQTNSTVCQWRTTNKNWTWNLHTTFRAVTLKSHAAIFVTGLSIRK